MSVGSKYLHIETPHVLQGQSATEVFKLFADKEWASLLDTCNNTLSDGRFDIIAVAPVRTVVAKNDVLLLDGIFHKNNAVCPFDLLDNVLADFKSSIDMQNIHYDGLTAAEIENLPFLVGALGQFGYDLNTRLDKIDNPDKNTNTPEYLADDFAVGIFDESLIFDNHTKQVFYCHLGRRYTESLFKTASQSAQVMPMPFVITEPWQSNVSESTYTENLHRIEKYLRAGDCYQVNYAQRFSTAYHGDEWQAYDYLRKINKAPFSSFIKHRQYTLMSVSPERFLQVKNGLVETKPIKGTRPRSTDPQQDKQNSDDLLNAEKDRAENLMIVDLLRNDLSKHCQAHSVKVPALFKLESYPAVHHMVSTVVGKIKPESSPIDLLKGGFPGGSITGAPKVRAMQIIQELEGNKRGIYCGSIGYIGIRGDMDTNICIRTLLAEQGRLYCWAGGGIVLDSKAQEEYQESFDKVARILPPLMDKFGPTIKTT